MRLLTAAFVLIAAASTGAVADDLELGKKVFGKCKACHAVGAEAKNKVGPILNGVLGREWGEVADYKYSKDKEGTLKFIAAAEEKTWDIETLTAYLTKPKDVIPKGKMAFVGLQKAEDIDNVIYFLAQYDAEGNEVDPDEVLAGLAEGE